jgi:hypothetical protein
MYNQLIFGEPASKYNELRSEYLSASDYVTYARDPALYRYQAARPREDKPCYRFGRACHSLILEGVTPRTGPINEKTGREYGDTTTAWAKATEESGCDLVTREELEVMRAMRDSVRSHPVAGDILGAGSAEVVVRSLILDIPCQCRMDWLGGNGTELADLKTCNDLDQFEYDARRLKYATKLTFHSMVAQKAVDLDALRFIAVEKKPPYRCGVWTLFPALVDELSTQIYQVLSSYMSSKVLGIYASAYEDERIITKE